MAEVDLNATINYIRGAIGGIVFKRVRGKTILTKKPTFKKPPSAAQLRQRQKFREATDYAKMAQADPVLRSLYEPVARKRQVAVFTAALRDYLNAPSIKCLYILSYRGKPGDHIHVHADDDFGLAALEVRLITPDGMLVESGQAVEAGLHSGSWTYTTTVEVAPGSKLRLEVTGTDYAGNRVQAAEEITLGNPVRIDVKARASLPQQPAMVGEARKPVPVESEEVVAVADELAALAPLCDEVPAAGGTAALLEESCNSQPADVTASPRT